jgi:hypothetical protein
VVAAAEDAHQPVQPEIVPAEGPAARFARSMVELVVGAPRVATAERVAAAGVSIAEFVGAPVRRVLEPAIDSRSDAAQDALVAFVELTRVMVQEAVELVDINAVLERIDLNALLRRIDLNELMARVDIGELLEHVDLNELIGRVDLDSVLARVDLNSVLARVDLDTVLARVDITELIGRVDVEALLDRIDMNEIVEKIDIDGIVERTEIGSLVVRSTSGVATVALDAVRSGAVGIDTTIARLVDRVLRRKPGPAGPGLLAPDARPAAPT